MFGRTDEQKAAQAWRENRTVKIDSLVPLEPSVVEPAVAQFREDLKSGASKNWIRISVVRVGDDLVVRDGTHRLRAMWDHGLRDADVEVRNPTDENDLQDKQSVVAWRRRNSITVPTLPLNKSSDDRAARIEADEAERRSSDFLASVAAAGPPPPATADPFEEVDAEEKEAEDAEQ